MAPAVYAAMALGAAGLLLALYMTLVEPRRFRVRRVTVRAGRLPALRILHLTDTHFNGRDGAILAFLERAGRQRAVRLCCCSRAT